MQKSFVLCTVAVAGTSLLSAVMSCFFGNTWVATAFFAHAMFAYLSYEFFFSRHRWQGREVARRHRSRLFVNLNRILAGMAFLAFVLHILT